MKFYQKSFQMFISILAICPLNAKRDFTIEISRIHVNVTNTKYVKSVDHKIFAGKVVFFELVLLKNITEFGLKFNFSLVKKDNRTSTILQLNVNGCDILHTYSRNNFLKIFFSEIFRISNLPKKCPFLANKPYRVNNYTLRAEDYPPQMPIMEFRVRADFLQYQQHYMAIVVSGRILKLNNKRAAAGMTKSTPM